ncbi:MAG: Hsp20/alpha crystallin family protein [Haloferacaceae archaeon]
MNIPQEAGSDGRIVRRYEYDDSWVLVADLGAAAGDVDVDIVGTTAILVAEDGEEVAEVEFELPGDDATVEVRNGVVTIEVAQ